MDFGPPESAEETPSPAPSLPPPPPPERPVTVAAPTDAPPPEAAQPGNAAAMVIAVAPEERWACDEGGEPPTITTVGHRIGYWFILGESWPAEAPDGLMVVSPRWSSSGPWGGIDLGMNLGVGDFERAAYLLEAFTIEPRLSFPPGMLHASAGFGFTLFGVDTLQERAVFSLLNPRLTWGLHVVLDQATLGLDGQFGYMLRLGDIPNITYTAAALSAAIHLDD